MLSSENVKSVQREIVVDPTAADQFHLFRAPRAITIKNAYMVAGATQNAGTAVLLELQNWGTAGTAVKTGGTVVAALGGTATAARLTANTPAAGTIDTSADNIAEGEWLVLSYTEQGAGWVAGDWFLYTVEYVDGQA
jgi:hypothetical protein